MWTHLIYLIISILFSWLWTNTPILSFYTLQLTALLIIIYFLTKKFKNKTLDALVLTTSILLLVFSTGGPGSPLFFLLYFLLFGISFLFEPTLTVSFSIILIVFLLPGVKSPQNFLKIFSLVFTAPLALFFGQQYIHNLANQKKIKIFKKKWIKNAEHLENQETNTLFWLSLNFKQEISEIIEITANLTTHLSEQSPQDRKLLEKIRKKAKRLLKQGEKLKEQVDKESDGK